MNVEPLGGTPAVGEPLGEGRGREDPGPLVAGEPVIDLKTGLACGQRTPSAPLSALLDQIRRRPAFLFGGKLSSRKQGESWAKSEPGPQQSHANKAFRRVVPSSRTQLLLNRMRGAEAPKAFPAP